jgi:hypothetical protein
VVYVGEKKKTSIKIDPKLWKEVRIEAIKRDMDVSELVERCLRKELGTKGEVGEPRRRT